jgi:hypothetical protein
MDVDGCDLIFRRATMVTVCAWMCLVASVYAITPSDEWVYLQTRNESAGGAVYVLVALFVLIHPLDYCRFMQRASHE